MYYWSFLFIFVFKIIHMEYNNYSYLYPPRPKNPIPQEDLDWWETRKMIGQLKFNGSNCSIYTNGIKIYVMNRHGERMTRFEIKDEEIFNLYNSCNKEVGSWMFINGEYMNKNKKDENNKSFNHKLIIFDIIVYDNDHLINSTFENRIELMDKLFGTEDSEKEYLYSVSENIYRVKSYYGNFGELFNKYTPIDMIEGLVLKKKNGKLENGIKENNTSKSQMKCRKETKNYKF